MSWDQNNGYPANQQQQGFYNPSAPEATSFYGNYGPGSDSAYPTAFMTPAPAYNSVGEGIYVDDEYANEPPLLEELGINPEHILQKTLSVLNPFRVTRPDVAGDADLAGPLVTPIPFLLFEPISKQTNYIKNSGPQDTAI